MRRQDNTRNNTIYFGTRAMKIEKYKKKLARDWRKRRPRRLGSYWKLADFPFFVISWNNFKQCRFVHRFSKTSCQIVWALLLHIWTVSPTSFQHFNNTSKTLCLSVLHFPDYLDSVHFTSIILFVRTSDRLIRKLNWELWNKEFLISNYTTFYWTVYWNSIVHMYTLQRGKIKEKTKGTE